MIRPTKPGSTRVIGVVAIALGWAVTVNAQEPSVFTPPVIAEAVAPAYPTGAAAPAEEVTVSVEVTVSADGSVTDASISRSAGEAFDQAAIEAVRQWRFQPAQWGAEPVVSRMTVPVRFVPVEAGEEPVGEDLEAELAAELAEIQTQQQGPPQIQTTAQPVAVPGGRGPSPRGLSSYMNPAMSANGLFLIGWSSHEEPAEEDEEGHEHGAHDLETGFHLQEVELQLSAIVDPFFRADLTFAAHAEHVGFEEVVFSTLEIPRMTIRGGKFYAAFGKQNLLHTHAFPFLTAPLPWRTVLGPEGLNDPGLSFDVLLPLPFYTEINVQAFSGDWRPFHGSIPDDPDTPEDESVPDQRRREDFNYVGHLKTLFDLTDSSTLELGGSYVGGRNGFGGWTHLVGGDLTIKWRPVEAERYTGLTWATECFWQDRQDAPHDAQSVGAYSYLAYQFAQRWWIEGQGSLLSLLDGAEGRTWRAQALAAFVPSHFSALRLQYAYQTTEASEADPIHEVFLQVIFSIGSHPVHAY